MGFGERLRLLRQMKHMTLDELALALETTKTTLSRYENSKRVPDAEFIVRVAQFFKVSSDYLLQLSSHPTRVEDLLNRRHYYVEGLSELDYKTLELFIEDLQHKSKTITKRST